MKFLLLLCFIAFVASVVLSDGDGSPESDEMDDDNDTSILQVYFQNTSAKVDETIAAGGGRQFFGGSDRDYCVDPCEEAFSKDGLRPADGTWDINKFCQAYDKMITCLNGCSGSAKEALLKKTAKDRWVCKESTFKHNSRCLERAFRAADKKNNCNRYRVCGKHDYDDGTLKDKSRQMCLAFKCRLDCRGPTIRSKCGESAYRDEAGFAKKAVEYLKWLFVDKSNLPERFAELECSRVLSIDLSG